MGSAFFAPTNFSYFIRLDLKKEKRVRNRDIANNFNNCQYIKITYLVRIKRKLNKVKTAAKLLKSD
jgi:hypothetical protein